jgi:hypothetical protein
MKTFTQHLLTFSLFFMTLSFLFPSYAHGQAPPLRIESINGGNGNTGSDEPCIAVGEEGGFVKNFYVTINSISFQDFFETCDLYIGYEMITTGMTYQAVPSNGFFPSNNNPNVLLFHFTVTFTAEEISAMCIEQEYIINLDLYCFDAKSYGDGMTSVTNGDGFNWPVKFCCEEEDDDDDDGDDDAKVRVSNTNQFSDYYIYDLHGNQIDILKNQSTIIPIQEHISNLSIQTGIYFVRFWNGTEMETTKVFKL